MMASRGRKQGTHFIFLQNILGEDAGSAVRPGHATVDLSQATLALYFKLGTFVINSVGRCFFKSTQHIVGGQEGGLGAVHIWEGLDKEVFSHQSRAIENHRI